MNFVDTCVIVSTSGAPFKWVVQSLLHMVLIPGLAFMVFYAGYVALAEDSAGSRLGQFAIGQLVLIVVVFLMSLVPFGCINGLFKLMVLGNITNQSSNLALDIAILVESSIWMACTAIAIMTLVQVQKYERYADVVDKSADVAHV